MYVYDDIVWYVGTTIDSLVSEYQRKPKTVSKKETVYRTDEEVRDYYQRLMNIGQADPE